MGIFELDLACRRPPHPGTVRSARPQWALSSRTWPWERDVAGAETVWTRYVTEPCEASVLLLGFGRQTQRSTHSATPQDRPCVQAPCSLNLPLPAPHTWSGHLPLPSRAAQLEISPGSSRVCASTEEKPRVQTPGPLLTVPAWLCLFPARRSPLRQPCLSFLIRESSRTTIAPVSWCGRVSCWCGFGVIT